MDSDTGYFWQTPIGNFCQFNIPVDSQLFSALEHFWETQHMWDFSSDDEDYSEEESEGEDDAY